MASLVSLNVVIRMADVGSDTAMIIVKVASALLIGIIILNGVDLSAGDIQNTATITLYSNPSDGKILTLDGVVFEFDNNSNTDPANIAVTIGASIEETMDNLATAIETRADYAVV